MLRLFRTLLEFKILKKLLLTKVERYLLKNNRLFTLGDCKNSDTATDSDIDLTANYDVMSQTPFFMKLLEDTKV